MVKRVKKTENVALGRRIKTAREKSGLVQMDFAREFGVSNITVSRWETGVQAPSDKIKRRISEITGTTLAYLMGETDDPHPVFRPQRALHVSADGGSAISTVAGDDVLSLNDLTWIPVISPEVSACRVSAGTGGRRNREEPWEKIGDFPLFDEKIAVLYNTGTLLSMYVDGDSMEPQVHDGDLVVFKKTSEWISGNMVVVCLDGRLMVKGLVRGPEGEILLRSTNKNYDDLIVGRKSVFLVYGKVIKIIRQLDPKPVV